MAERSASAIIDISSSLELEVVDLGEHSSPDGAVTIFFSDIAGATELVGRLGEGPWMAVIEDYNAKMRGLADSHGGAEVKSQRDGFMFAFTSAHAGLRCAIEAQRAFAGQSVPGSGEPVRVRVGLHTGFVMREADDFFGRNVVLAARIADHASGGQILVSSALKEYTESDPTLAFEYYDDVHFKGVLGEHTIYAVRW